MNTISSSLPTVPPAVSLGRHAKSSGQVHSRSASGAANTSLPDASAAPSAAPDADLDGVLARIQGQNQASALTTIADLNEALAATQLARQDILNQSAAARSAHAGVTPAAALRVLED